MNGKRTLAALGLALSGWLGLSAGAFGQARPRFMPGAVASPVPFYTAPGPALMLPGFNGGYGGGFAANNYAAFAQGNANLAALNSAILAANNPLFANSWGQFAPWGNTNNPWMNPWANPFNQVPAWGNPYLAWGRLSPYTPQWNPWLTGAMAQNLAWGAWNPYGMAMTFPPGGPFTPMAANGFFQQANPFMNGGFPGFGGFGGAPVVGVQPPALPGAQAQ